MKKSNRGLNQTTASKDQELNRKFWVISVVIFWLSAAITGTAAIITGKVDLVLVSITLAAMVFGVYFKVKLQIRNYQDKRQD